MAARHSDINVSIANSGSVIIRIYPLSSDPDSIKEVYPETEYMSPYQLKEGCIYEYELIDPTYQLLIDSRLHRMIEPSLAHPQYGRITPNTYVGRLQLTLINREDSKKTGHVTIEIRSSKTDYLTEYRAMLSDITEYCTELLLHHNSPVTQQLTADFSVDAKTLYQRFAFVRSMIDAPEFQNAIQRILHTPASTWTDDYQHTDIRRVKRVTSGIARQIVGASRRGELPTRHPLHKHIQSVPLTINQKCRQEIFDTPENRFIKHVLHVFVQFAQDIIRLAPTKSQIVLEAESLETQLEQWLSHSLFRQIGKLDKIKLNSPILQRKEGYREVTRVWHMFDLAAKLVWQGGDDVYEGGKRDVGTLYEYWLFFKLLSTFQDLFKIDDVDLKQLIVPTSDGMHLQLKAGKHIALSGLCEVKGRQLCVAYSYNRSFSGASAYPRGGSWTLPMRPDYTLSIWPAELSANEAEERELIVHLHFDAKYRVENISKLFQNTSEDEAIQKKLDYKRIDLLKMHAYRDAIRRTAGAYILYPGDQDFHKVGYHELLPGIGAFHIRPSSGQTGLHSFKAFISEVIDHLANRASQHERLTHRIFNTFNDKPTTIYNGWYPTFDGDTRSIPPQDIYVLIAFYRTEEQLDWIQKKLLYNLRLEGRGSENVLDARILNAKLLLLHGPGKTESDLIFEIVSTQPRIFSKQQLVEQEYPTTPSQNQYLVFNIKELQDVPKKHRWDVCKLSGYQQGRWSAAPFTETLVDFMKIVTIQSN